MDQYERDALAVAKRRMPEIICLCGSTRFFKTFDEQNFRLTLAGKIVLTIGCNTKSDDGLLLTEEDKRRLDELHKRKIDLCDRVLVLNVGGYIGDSTRSEIAYARENGKPIDWLEHIDYAALNPRDLDSSCEGVFRASQFANNAAAKAERNPAQ
jgi:hypothetical protein